jgi:hypothetical protein
VYIYIYTAGDKLIGKTGIEKTDRQTDRHSCQAVSTVSAAVLQRALQELQTADWFSS